MNILLFCLSREEYRKRRGHCGFGMGATPTAIANMQAVTDRFGPSHVAFLVVPMVGAFFLDLINALVIPFFLALPIFPAAGG